MKTYADELSPVDSLESVFKVADWYEREVRNRTNVSSGPGVGLQKEDPTVTILKANLPRKKSINRIAIFI